MKLLVLAGLVRPPTREQIGAEGMAALVLAAEQALRGGVVFGEDFWAGCTDYEREALAQASDRIAADRAALYGAASLGLRQAAMAAAHKDGGMAVRAVSEAEEIATNKAAADRALQRALGESAFVGGARQVTEISQVELPKGIA